MNSAERIFCVIASSNGSSGVGGHYFSAITIVQELKKRYVVDFINAGDFYAESLSSSSVESSFIPVSLKCISEGRRVLLNRLHQFSPDVVLAFDVMAGLIVRPLSIKAKCGFVLLKAGGDIPLSYYPRSRFQIHFTERDVTWAQSRVMGTPSLIKWIPNRVSLPVIDFQAIEELRKEIDIRPEELVVIRIGRITEYYRKAFEASFQLKEFIQSSGLNARLLVIGDIESSELAEELRARCDSRDVVLTDKRWTRSASRLLPIATINVGVGRGFMEGCSVKHFMFCVDRSSDLPVPVTDENLSVFFRSNFSLRASLPCSEAERKSKIQDLLLKMTSTENGCEYSFRWYERYFSSEKIPESYGPILRLASENVEKWNGDALIGELYVRTYELQSQLKRLVPNKLMKSLKLKLRQAKARS